MLNRLQILALVAFSFGCQTTTDPATKAFPDQALKVKGSSFGGVVGINADDKLVIRKTTDASDELASIELANTYLRDRAQAAVFELSRCRDDLSDKRLGGSGKLPPASPDVAALASTKPDELMGTNAEGDLVIVQEQEFTQKIKSEKKLSTQLQAVRDRAELDLKACSRDLAEARRDHGLRGKPYAAEGYHTRDGTWVSNQHGESDLDSAFEAEAKAAGK